MMDLQRAFSAPSVESLENGCDLSQLEKASAVGILLYSVQ